MKDGMIYWEDVYNGSMTTCALMWFLVVVWS